jgi:deoxyribonuclease-1
MKILLTIIILSTYFYSVTSAHALTFSKAKVQLKKIYADYPTSFYCGCDIKYVSNKKLVPDWYSCQYTPRKQPKRAARIEFEHVVPASEFGHQRMCWQNGGRKNCTKTDDIFSEMEGDLHNLVPAIGEVNGDRSNYKFSMIAGEERLYGQCDAEVDFKRRIFEPPSNVQGDIARTYRYFSYQYGLKISNKQQKLFNAWNKTDPVDTKECLIHTKKARIQGNVNPFVAKYCNDLRYK